MPLNGADKPTIICANKAGEEGEWWQVRPDGLCGNFGNNGHAPGKIEEALAEGAKLIGLSQGKVAIVDAADYEDLGQYKWCAIKGDSTYYAARRNGKKMVRMHREIMNAPPEMLVDHREHNGLDNRKSNLRICTRAENTRNQRLHKRGSTGYKGVSWHKKQKIFHAYIGYNSKKIWLGRFNRATQPRNPGAYHQTICEQLVGRSRVNRYEITPGLCLFRSHIVSLSACGTL